MLSGAQQVLRQQGLEYTTWKKEVEQRRAKLEGAPQVTALQPARSLKPS